MFGNDFIDFCNINYVDLVTLSHKGIDELTAKYLSDYAKVFISFYSSLTDRKKIPISEFLQSGIDFQRLCLLVFLIFLREGNESIAMTKTEVIYHR